IVAVKEAVSVRGLTCRGPLSKYHTQSVVRAFQATRDTEWIWWFLPPLPNHGVSFTDICESDAPVDSLEKTNTLLDMLSEKNINKLNAAKEKGVFIAGTGYKRIRKEANGEKIQRLEIRFDGISGCLRTPRGGSSRQVVVIVDGGEVKTRLLTIREAARLMGVRDTFKIPGTYNEAYRALGDAVAVPVTSFLANHLLVPLCQRASNGRKG
ncbi:MAG: DNA cytosine methyltransferase, partial [Candidatus Latescibacterota bacterium]